MLKLVSNKIGTFFSCHCDVMNMICLLYFVEFCWYFNSFWRN